MSDFVNTIERNWDGTLYFYPHMIRDKIKSYEQEHNQTVVVSAQTDTQTDTPTDTPTDTETITMLSGVIFETIRINQNALDDLMNN